MNQRITRLEELFAHLERVVGDLNEVLVAQGRRLDALELELARCTRIADTLRAASETRSALDERPPHY